MPNLAPADSRERLQELLTRDARTKEVAGVTLFLVLGVVVLFLGMTWAGVFGLALAVIIVALVPVGTAVCFAPGSRPIKRRSRAREARKSAMLNRGMAVGMVPPLQGPPRD